MTTWLILRVPLSAFIIAVSVKEIFGWRQVPTLMETMEMFSHFISQACKSPAILVIFFFVFFLLLGSKIFQIAQWL